MKLKRKLAVTTVLLSLVITSTAFATPVDSTDNLPNEFVSSFSFAPKESEYIAAYSGGLKSESSGNITIYGTLSTYNATSTIITAQLQQYDNYIWTDFGDAVSVHGDGRYGSIEEEISADSGYYYRAVFTYEALINGKVKDSRSEVSGIEEVL